MGSDYDNGNDLGDDDNHLDTGRAAIHQICCDASLFGVHANHVAWAYVVVLSIHNP